MQTNSLPIIDNDADPLLAAIESASPFHDLPPAVLAALAESASLRRYNPGETIYAMGQFDGSEFLIVKTGAFKAARADTASGAMLFEYIKGGEAYGLAHAVLEDDQRNALLVTLTAESACEIVSIDAEALRHVAAQRPSLTRNLMLYFARKVSGDAAPADETSPERRVYATLSMLVEREHETGEWRIERMPKHRELAEKAGVDETEAANAVAKLIQSGVARRIYPGLVIDDIAQLSRLAR